MGLPWPRGLAEQCSRLRKKCSHCLSAASLRTAGVGELRRAPEELAPAEAGGHATANMLLSPVAKPKWPRLPGRTPAYLLKTHLHSCVVA